MGLNTKQSLSAGKNASWFVAVGGSIDGQCMALRVDPSLGDQGRMMAGFGGSAMRVGEETYRLRAILAQSGTWVDTFLVLDGMTDDEVIRMMGDWYTGKAATVQARGRDHERREESDEGHTGGDLTE